MDAVGRGDWDEGKKEDMGRLLGNEGSEEEEFGKWVDGRLRLGSGWVLSDPGKS